MYLYLDVVAFLMILFERLLVKILVDIHHRNAEILNTYDAASLYCTNELFCRL